ncbi:hypothetical protein GAPWK_2699 [Gilliamella apicola]|nr:hypothetical protein GAPWK_2699 [Gilliamella apicola]
MSSSKSIGGSGCYAGALLFIATLLALCSVTKVLPFLF